MSLPLPLPVTLSTAKSFLLSWRAPVILLPTYLIVVRLLRYARMNYYLRRMPYKRRDQMANMTSDDAHEIQDMILGREFPFMGEKGLQFALFRTYGIASGTKLLVETRQLVEEKFAAKRYTDTAVLITEIVGQPPSSDRHNEAIARLNHIHGYYQKSGRIRMEDMLYTLALFAMEPIRWINRYEWRQINEMERCAFGVFWKATGDAMNISYEYLPSYKTGWRDGLHWLEELEVWSVEYEKKEMYPDDHNQRLAEETTKILINDLPNFLQGFARQAIASLMDDRLIEAMRYERPSPAVSKTVHGFLWIRKMMLRHLFLPRPYFMRMNEQSDPDPKTGVFYRYYYEKEPWYVKPTVMNRWGPSALMRRAQGKPVPGDDPRFHPEGLTIHQCGPKRFQGKGVEEVEQYTKVLMGQQRGGCPFYKR